MIIKIKPNKLNKIVLTYIIFINNLNKINLFKNKQI